MRAGPLAFGTCLGLGHETAALVAFTLIAALLILELLPAPRTLHPATIPAIYGIVKADPRPIKVMTLPFGLRDGLNSFGNTTAASQFYQTFHGHGLMGGYLSRVSHERHARLRRSKLRGALIRLSEGRQDLDYRMERDL